MDTSGAEPVSKLLRGVIQKSQFRTSFETQPCKSGPWQIRWMPPMPHRHFAPWMYHHGDVLWPFLSRTSVALHQPWQQPLQQQHQHKLLESLRQLHHQFSTLETRKSRAGETLKDHRPTPNAHHPTPITPFCYSPSLHYARADEMTALDVGIKCCLCCTTFIGFDKTDRWPGKLHPAAEHYRAVV